ncbi:MAG: FeoA family protein [Candidatus Hodarchaeales archaeon]
MKHGYRHGGRKGRRKKHGFFKRLFHDIENQGLMPLSNLTEGHRGIIRYLNGGPRVVNRIAELGFVPGEKVKVMKNFGFGPVMVEIRGSRMGIGRGLSEKIIVEKLPLAEREDSVEKTVTSP